MTRVALVTAQAALPLDEDMPPLVAALVAAGAEVATPCWDDASVDWAQFDVALLRSTWDYVDRLEEFLAWTQRCGAATRLLNPPEVVQWNVDKHYLAELAAAGVAVVPTAFVEPGEAVEAALEEFLETFAPTHSQGTEGGSSEFVVKPTVGAGSRDAARYRVADRTRALEHLRRLVELERRSAMLQPYLPDVDVHGETALIHFDGEPSHAIRKGPLLPLDGALVQGLFAPEEITAREPSAEERALAATVGAALPFATPLYARVDMIRMPDGRPVVLELELTEPSLFLAHAPGSADRLAAALLRRK